MGFFSDLISANPVVQVLDAISVVRHAWRKPDSRRTAPPAPVELLAGLTRTNVYPFFVDNTSGWNEYKINQVLNPYGIKAFGAYTFGDDLVFYVRIGQANFAQWLMERAGVPLKHRVLAGRVGKRKRKRGYRRRKSGGAEQRGGISGFIDGLESLADEVQSSLGL